MENETILKFQQAKELYLTGNYFLTQLGKNFHISRGCFSKWLKEQGIKVINKQNDRPTNFKNFDEIDTEEKAYWLGFLYADGYVGKDYHIELGLQERDKEHIEKFKSFLGCDAKISYREKTKSYRLIFTNYYLAKRLHQLGVIPNKSLKLIQIPEEVPEYLLKHFVRGFIDGDGCLRLTYQKNGTPCPRFEITSGSPLFVLDIINKMNWKICNYRKHKDNNAYQFEWGRFYTVDMMDNLYENSTIYLQRKYDKYIEIKTAVLNRNNH